MELAKALPQLRPVFNEDGSYADFAIAKCALTERLGVARVSPGMNSIGDVFASIEWEDLP